MIYCRRAMSKIKPNRMQGKSNCKIFPVCPWLIYIFLKPFLVHIGTDQKIIIESQINWFIQINVEN